MIEQVLMIGRAVNLGKSVTMGLMEEKHKCDSRLLTGMPAPRYQRKLVRLESVPLGFL